MSIPFGALGEEFLNRNLVGRTYKLKIITERIISWDMQQLNLKYIMNI